VTELRWQRVKDVLQNALARAPGERAAYLEQACQGDADLRNQVEELLSSDERMGDFLAAPAWAASGAAILSEMDEPLAGRLIGPYRVLRELGSGGMGTVYLAERADGQYRKRVAIKLMNSAIGGGDLLRRFRNERQLLSDLDHPHIARLIDGGATEEGLPYLVMDYIEGVRIDAWCEARKLALPDRLLLFQEVCSAVRYAHEHGVIHRDIKPANILVTGDGTAKLLDFGIAKLVDAGSSELTETTGGAGPMTPAYASPEQARGEAASVASDIYALGLVLYELLTGTLPPRWENPPGSGGKLPRDLDYVLDKALRNEPEDRYRSVAEFSQDLDRFLQIGPCAHESTPCCIVQESFSSGKRQLSRPLPWEPSWYWRPSPD
jgi:serine/threonine protein kinase